jgi:hypothetical protein
MQTKSDTWAIHSPINIYFVTMKILFVITFFLLQSIAYSQTDSTSKKSNSRTALTICGITATYGIGVIGMNELWYKKYPRASFRWIDDSREWLQMDKCGHFYTSCISARSISGGFESAGMNHKKSVYLGSGIAMLAISTIEVFDGVSAGWGASPSDLIANSAGVALFASQSLLWNEEKIIPKFSWHPSKYAAYRPNVLGENFPQRLLKDYNGQTYWLSFNLKSLTGAGMFPPWLCFSLGYGAEGMTSGYDNKSMVPYFKRYRQYYLSFDADLNKVVTRSKILNRVLRGINLIKVPFPSICLSSEGSRVYGMYF